MQALLLDVKNYEAFRELVEGSMMSSSEGVFFNKITNTVGVGADDRMGIHQ